MKTFDSRWQQLTARARESVPADAEAPVGFAAGVAHRALGRGTSAPDLVWDRLLVRFLLGALAALVACAAVEARHFKSPRALESGIENSVAELVWSL